MIDHTENRNKHAVMEVNPENGEILIDLQKTFLKLKADWKFIVGSVLLVCSVLGSYLYYLPDQYTSKTLLSPSDKAGGGLADLARQYGGIAGLAGLAIPSGDGSNESKVALEILQSRQFITKFVRERDILVELMAVKRWDELGNALVVDGNLYDENTKTWVRKVSPPRTVVPSSEELYEEFIERLSVSEDASTGFVTVSFTHHSPTIAQIWLVWLVADLNLFVRSKEVVEAEKSIEYLEKKITETTISDLRDGLSELIKTSMNTVMLAEVKDEYILETVDPPFIPEKPVSPNRILLLILGAIVTACLASACVLSRKSVDK